MLAINSTQFFEGYKGLGHHVSSISSLYQMLLQSPRTVAEFLHATEKLSLNVFFLNIIQLKCFVIILCNLRFP